MGAMSDPYNPLEKELNLTSSALSLIHRARFGVGLATKSHPCYKRRGDTERDKHPLTRYL